jgi:hypothetical protein
MLDLHDYEHFFFLLICKQIFGAINFGLANKRNYKIYMMNAEIKIANFYKENSFKLL